MKKTIFIFSFVLLFIIPNVTFAENIPLIELNSELAVTVINTMGSYFDLKLSAPQYVRYDSQKQLHDYKSIIEGGNYNNVEVLFSEDTNGNVCIMTCSFYANNKDTAKKIANLNNIFYYMIGLNDLEIKALNNSIKKGTINGLPTAISKRWCNKIHRYVYWAVACNANGYMKQMIFCRNV